MPPEELCHRLRESGSVSFPVRVQPRAPQTGWAGLLGETLKVRVAAPPERGKANAELIRFLAAEFGVPAGAVEIAAGAGAQAKLVRIRLRAAP